MNCTDCKRELYEEEAIHIAYQLLGEAGVLLEWELPVCMSCLEIREYVLKRTKRAQKGF